MKFTIKSLFFLLTVFAIATPTFAQNYSFSDSQVRQTGYQDQAGPYYTSYGRQDELPSPRLPAGSTGMPTDLPQLDPQDLSGSQPRNSPPMGTGVEPQTPLPMETRSRSRDMAMPSQSGTSMNLSSPMASPSMNMNSGGMYGQPIDGNMTMNFGDSMGSVLMEPVNQPILGSQMADPCGCGNECDGTCEGGFRLGQGNLGLGGLNLNGASVGSGFGSNLGNFRSLFQGGPMYAFFDFGGSFSEAESSFSDGIAGLASSDPFGHKDSFIFGAGLGKYLTEDFRVDLSARHRYVELEDQVFGAFPDAGFLADGGNDVWTAMLTGRHNLPGIHPCIKPYLSLGIGLAQHRAQASTRFSGLSGFTRQAYTSGETTEFAWAVGGGVAFKMTHNMFFDLDYQYIDMGDGATNATGSRSVLFDELTANELTFRLRFNF